MVEEGAVIKRKLETSSWGSGEKSSLKITGLKENP